MAAKIVNVIRRSTEIAVEVVMFVGVLNLIVNMLVYLQRTFC